MTTAVRLLSSDSPEQRAANLMFLAGITTGDPKILADQQREIARGLEAYRACDEEARR